MDENLAAKLLEQLLISNRELDKAINLINDEKVKKEFCKIAYKQGPLGAIEYLNYLFPLLHPKNQKVPSQKECMAAEFDDSNPWHKNAYTNFMFRAKFNIIDAAINLIFKGI